MAFSRPPPPPPCLHFSVRDVAVRRTTCDSALHTKPPKSPRTNEERPRMGNRVGFPTNDPVRIDCAMKAKTEPAVPLASTGRFKVSAGLQSFRSAYVESTVFPFIKPRKTQLGPRMRAHCHREPEFPCRAGEILHRVHQSFHLATTTLRDLPESIV